MLLCCVVLCDCDCGEWVAGLRTAEVFFHSATASSAASQAVRICSFVNADGGAVCGAAVRAVAESEGPTCPHLHRDNIQTPRHTKAGHLA